MSHRIYHTEAIIIGSALTGESNKLFFFLTKEFGFVPAVAQGIRELKSKLRYSLQDFCVADISIVRGKDIWRVVNAEPVNGRHTFSGNIDKTMMLARVFKLLRRMLHGEERDDALYDVVYDTLLFLEEDLTSEDIYRLEIATNLKILYRLGYGGNHKDFHSIINSPPSMEVLSMIAPVRGMILADINESIRASQL